MRKQEAIEIVVSVIGAALAGVGLGALVLWLTRSWGLALVALIIGALILPVALGATRRSAVSIARQQNEVVVRELVRRVIPMAVAHATRPDGSVDADRFRDLVVGSVAAQVSPAVGLGERGPAAWEVEETVVRTPEQESRLQRLLTYPEVNEAPALLAALDGMGPQTVDMFATFARGARSRLGVGLDDGLVGPAEAVLTARLVAAGLVDRLEAMAPAGGPPLEADQAVYTLSEQGVEVARLFAPVTPRPQELARLDRGLTH